MGIARRWREGRAGRRLGVWRIESRPRFLSHHIDCPHCHTPMIALTVHGHSRLKYESCTVCYGAFFDAGEFREYLSAGGSWFRKVLSGIV